MGVVYRAEQQYPHRSVAIKLITPDLSSDPGFRERFMRETEATASLDHPNIIPIYEAGIADALLYIVMRYVDGPDLRAVLLRDGHLTPEQTVNVTDQVGRALDAAVRSRGLIHRDVKPANILLANSNDGASGHVYLCDFGLAKQVGSSSGLTGTGAVIGTIDYMAPEQIREDVVDGRADVYSLGCVVYHLLTGHAPFQGSGAKVMWSHLNDQAQPVSESGAAVPPATDGVLAKALAKDPLERYEDCGHLVHDLRAALSGSSMDPLSRVTCEPISPDGAGLGAGRGRTAACAAAGGIAPAVGARRPASCRDCRRGRGDRPGSSSRLRRYAWRQPRCRQRPQLRPGTARQPACRGCFRRLGGRGLANRPPRHAHPPGSTA